jgi:hypothetical protein
MANKMIQVLDQLHEDGTLSRLAASGFISGSVLVWRNVYHRYTQELDTTKSKMQAMENTAEEFNLSLRSVQYIRDRIENF